jgi:NAD(P)-dependent dehydrogenase (short-subunit alcohol dehydrogenase family)
MTEHLSGRAVLVFGASGALGGGVAAAFAGAGASVTGADRALPAGDAALDAVSYEAVDVTDDAAVRALFDSRPARKRSELSRAPCRALSAPEVTNSFIAP